MRTLGRFNSVWMFEAANVGAVVAAITDLLQAKRIKSESCVEVLS